MEKDLFVEFHLTLDNDYSSHHLTVVWDFGHSPYDISLLTSFAEKIDMPFFGTRCCDEVDINQHLLATAEAPTLGSNIPMPQVPRRASLGNILPCLGSSRFCRVFPAFISAAKNRRETWTEENPKHYIFKMTIEGDIEVVFLELWKLFRDLSTRNYIVSVMSRGIRSASKGVATTSPVTFWRKTSGGVLVCCHAPSILMVSWSILGFGDLIFTHCHFVSFSMI